MCIIIFNSLLILGRVVFFILFFLLKEIFKFYVFLMDLFMKYLFFCCLKKTLVFVIVVIFMKYVIYKIKVYFFKK